MFEPYLSKESDMPLPERFSDDWMDGCLFVTVIRNQRRRVSVLRRKYEFLQEPPLQFYIGR